jgi:hypothetical protein
LVLEALLLPILVSAGFRSLGVARTQALLRRWALLLRKRDIPTDAQTQIATAVCAQRLIERKTGIGGTCLVRSLTLWAMLLRRGIEMELRVGMRKFAGKFEGHAWLEHQGVPANENSAMVKAFPPYEHPISFDTGPTKGP